MVKLLFNNFPVEDPNEDVRTFPGFNMTGESCSGGPLRTERTC